MLIIALLGCRRSEEPPPTAADPDPDTGAPADSTGPHDTGDTGAGDSETDTECDTGWTAPYLDRGPGEYAGLDTGAWAPPELYCGLSAPLPIDPVSLPELDVLRGPSEGLFYALGVVLEHKTMFSEGECPRIACDGAFSGPCESGGFTYEGRYLTMPTYVAENMRATSDGSTEELDGISHWDFNHYVHDDYRYATMVGTPSEERWSVQADGLGDASSWMLTWQASFTPAGGSLQDWCATVEVDWSRGCAREPWGGWVIQGDARVVATYDPDDVCDGCANVTVDGVDAGISCDPYPTW